MTTALALQADKGLTKDPYHDAFLDELLLMVKPLQVLRDRVTTLLQTWPENAILQRIFDLTNKLESLPMSAPLMRWLVGLEALLGKTDEWERVASRDVSLAKEMHDLSRYVIRWRRIELESWGSVLDKRENDANKRTSQWWFNLHEVVETALRDPHWTRKPFSWLSGQRGEFDLRKETVEVFDVLDQFARTATLGDFIFRRDLLEAFAGYARLNLNGKDSTLTATLENLSAYYGQFAPSIRESLVKGRQPIQAKLADHVRIAQWDDRNYFALRESAEKSHRVIHKLARAYDEVLESPAHVAMEQFANENGVFETPSALAKAPFEPTRLGPVALDIPSINFPSWDAAPSNLSLARNVASVAARAEKLLATRALKALMKRAENGGSLADELNSDARERLASLTKESPTQLKKRALIDFFSTLKDQGLLEGSIWREIRDNRTVFSGELRLDRALPGVKAFQSMDDMLFRTLAQVTRLRRVAASPDRSTDLAQDEVTRGIKTSELLLEMLMRERQALVETLGRSRPALRRQQDRLHLVVSGQVVVLDVKGEQLSEWLESVLGGVEDLNFLLSKLAPNRASIDVSLLLQIRGDLMRMKRLGISSETNLANFEDQIRKQITQLGKIVKTIVESDRIPSCSPLMDLFQKVDSKLNSLRATASENEDEKYQDDVQLQDAIDSLVERCMLGIQAACTSSLTPNDENEEEAEEEETIVKHHTYVLSKLSALGLESVESNLEKLTDILSARLIKDASLVPVLRLVSTVLSLADNLTNSLLGFHASLIRFTHFCVAVFRTLCEKGFCRPPEEQDEDGSGQPDENMREGTGMGEGQGREDVSKEIEDEEQLLGLKGEDEKQQSSSQKDNKPKKEEDGVEMENDFEGGEMHDVEPEEEKDDEKDDDNLSNEEEKEELDRNMGDLNDQEQVVDERMWDSEEDEDDKPEDEKQQDKFEKDAPMDGTQDDTDELRAKSDEGDDKEQAKPKKEEEQRKKDKGKKDREQEQEGESDKINKPEEEEEGHDVGEKEVFTESESENPEGEHSDQDDDGEPPIEDNEMEQDGPDDEAGAAGDDQQPPIAEQEPEDFDLPKPELDGPDVQTDDEDEVAENGADDEQDDKGEDEEAVGNDEDEDQEETADPDAGKLSLDAPAKQDEQENQHEEDDESREKPQGNATGSSRTSAIDSQENADRDQQRPPEDASEEDTTGTRGDRSAGASGKRYQRGTEKQPPRHDQASSNPREDDDDSNPFRDPGDAAKEWSRRLKIVKSDGAMDIGDENSENEGEEHPPKEVEYSDNRDSKSDKQSLQALGEKRDQDEAVRLDAEKEMREEVDPEQQDKNTENEEEPDETKPSSDKNFEPKSDKKRGEKKNREEKKKGFFDDLDEELSEDDSAANKSTEDVEQETAPILPDDRPSHVLVSATTAPQIPTPVVTSATSATAPLVIDDSKSDMAENLSDLQLEKGRAAWTDAVTATHEMAQRLCEQLRLVLEPTQASKLRGDYRTGKRINMRRVIPFIASQFRKDKIWLRRTKPSRRKYHVALAIDDSKSMKPASQLALAALALISRALTQLEVGEVGVWSFGDQVRKLHALDQPFSDVAGAKVAARFTFAQDSTCIEDGLGAVVEALTEAAQNAPQTGFVGGDQPKQIAFVISDGRFDTGLRPRMAKWLRLARERKQLVALIVVEPPGGETILDLKQVSFTSTGVGGMKVGRYLEDYPFPYYIVLRDMAVLPEVLADGLRQWFELVINDDK